MTWTDTLENAILGYFSAVAQERQKLAQDLQLGSVDREAHAVIGDLAQAVVHEIAGKPEPAGEPAPEQAPPAAPPQGA